MAQNTFDLIPHIVINPTSICSYNEIIFHSPRSKQGRIFFDYDTPMDKPNTFLESTRKNNGSLSYHAVRKLKKAIEYLVTTSTEKKVIEKVYSKKVIFRTAFITLTLPSTQIHSDSEIINKCLNSFLNECRQHYKMKKYVWRAERQKNGNIHFHILIDTFIPWNELRNRWNRIINKLGYVDKFQAKHNHKTPNSTDIHSTKKVKNIKEYLTKYMTKSETKCDTIEFENISKTYQSGRIWGCSHELSNTRGLNLVVDNEISEELKKVLDNSKISCYEGSYFKVWHINYHSFRNYGSNILFKYFSDYLFEKLGFSEQLKLIS
jgi:hypothetical protein